MFAPGWIAYDMRLMMGRFQRDGMAAAQGDVDRPTEPTGATTRFYQDFAIETTKQLE